MQMPHIEHEPSKPVAQVTAQCHIVALKADVGDPARGQKAMVSV